MDEVRFCLPAPHQRSKGVPPYLPFFEPAFGRYVCEQYFQRHDQRTWPVFAEGHHPLDPSGYSRGSALATAGWAVQKRGANILILPTHRTLPLARNLIPVFLQFPAPSVVPPEIPSKFPVLPRFLDYTMLAVDTVYITVQDDRLSITPKAGEALYLAWLSAAFVHDTLYPQLDPLDIFFRIFIDDLTDIVRNSSNAVQIDRVQLVDASHASAHLVPYSDLRVELVAALAGATRLHQQRGAVDKLFSPAAESRLRGTLERVGLNALARSLSRGCTPHPDGDIVEQITVHRQRNGSFRVSRWSAGNDGAVFTDVYHGDPRTDRLHQVTTILKELESEVSHDK